MVFDNSRHPIQKEQVVKCLVCGLECPGEEAGKHQKETGHNKWELLTKKKQP